MEAEVSAEPSMASLPALDSFAFTSSSNRSTYAEGKGRRGSVEECSLEVGTSSAMKKLLQAPKEVREANKESPLLVVELLKAHTESLPMSRHENGSVECGVHEEHAEDSSKLGAAIPGACDVLVDVAHALVADLEGLTFRAPVSCVYNPLVYAQDLHKQYIRRHGGRRIEVLLVGMNPGPFGMAQTGVPFGDSSFVRTFHGLSGKVETPEITHPKRPVHGLDCKRSEISGQRLWGWAQDRFGCATAFFNRFWVYNYCPLVFMEASGKNRTPDKLHPLERTQLERACNTALVKTVSILRPAFVIGVGKYAASKIEQCNITGVKLGDIMHPSPANPHANKDWGKKVEAQLLELGIELPK